MKMNLCLGAYLKMKSKRGVKIFSDHTIEKTIVFTWEQCIKPRRLAHLKGPMDVIMHLNRTLYRVKSGPRSENRESAS